MHTIKIRQRCKVAFVMPHLDAGGVERVVVNVLTHLDRSRFAPALILFNRRGALLERVPQDVEIHDLSGGKARWLPLRLARTFAASGTEVAYGGTNAANLASLVAASLMRRSPAIIASEHTPPAPYLSDAKMRRLRLPLMRLLYPRAAAVAVPVGRLGDDLREVLRLPSLHVVTLPNPVLDTLPQPSQAVPDQGAAFLTAGRLSPEKGFDILIAAFARLSLGKNRGCVAFAKLGVKHANPRRGSVGAGRERAAHRT
jgi:glycosyltransferase involved in cell wall biosynthesis